MPDPRSREGMPDLYAYAHALGTLRREQPGEDVMSILMAQRDDSGGSVSVRGVREPLLALRRRRQRDDPQRYAGRPRRAARRRLTRSGSCGPDPDGIPNAVEEMLRWWTPVMTFRRTATCDVELSGVSAATRGDKVVVSFAAANRDPEVFAAPDVFDIGRAEREAAPGLRRWSARLPRGVLARSMMTTMFTQLLGRTNWLEAAGEPVWLQSNFQRGVKRLPITWRA
jgi:cytochrome P450